MKNTTTEQQASAASQRRPRLQIGLSFFAFILIGANDGAVGVLLPSMMFHYHVNKGTIGLVFLSMTLGYLISAINSGLLVEKLGPRRYLMLGAALISLSMFTISLAPPFLIFVAALLPLGFGVAVIDAGLNAYIAGLPRNAALLNYLHAFYGSGALLGPLVASGMLALQIDWNHVYDVWIGMSLILFVGFALVFKDQHAAAQESARAQKTEGNLLFNALRLHVVWIAAFFLVFYTGTEVSLGSWSYSFLTEVRHGPTLLSGWVISGYWLGLTLGRLFLGHVAQRIGSKRLIEFCLLGVIAGVLLVWLVPAEGVSAFGLCFTGFCLGPIFPTTIALTSELVPGRLLNSAIGFLSSMGSVGVAFFPWLAGNLAQYLGLWTLLPYVIALTLVMGLLWLSLRARPQATE
ncbi:MAG TPA: MFS transporter [Ktedonobacteraceae bacterium]|nr:MFS transporter [Ktedonobacteraceae bacterium]